MHEFLGVIFECFVEIFVNVIIEGMARVFHRVWNVFRGEI